MAEASGDLEPETNVNYKAPEKKTLDELQKLDAEDESLRRYKEALLAGAKDGGKPFPDDPRNVIVDKLIIAPEGRPDVEINLRNDLSKLKESPVVLKEGTKYCVKIVYYVQSEIVSGLKYIMATYRGPMKVDKDDVMIGSQGPQKEPYVWCSQQDEAPKGMMARGTYTVKSRFTDDDKTDHLTWEWCIKIKEDWAK